METPEPRTRPWCTPTNDDIGKRVEVKDYVDNDWYSPDESSTLLAIVGGMFVIGPPSGHFSNYRFWKFTRIAREISPVTPQEPPEIQPSEDNWRTPTNADIGKRVEVRDFDDDEWVKYKELITLRAIVDRKFVLGPACGHTVDYTFWKFARIDREIYPVDPTEIPAQLPKTQPEYKWMPGVASEVVEIGSGIQMPLEELLTWGEPIPVGTTQPTTSPPKTQPVKYMEPPACPPVDELQILPETAPATVAEIKEQSRYQIPYRQNDGRRG